MASTDPTIKALRDRLDQVDSDLIELAAERQRIVSEIGRVKQGRKRALRDFRRERQVLDGVRSRAEGIGLDPDLAEDLLRRLIEASLTTQEQERGRLAARGDGRRALVIGGGGLMGGWLAGFLDNQGFVVSVADPALSSDAPTVHTDWREAPLEQQDVVAVAAPIRASADILADLARRDLRALVFDIGSIKTPLIEPLRAAANAKLKVCSIHPMFGPDTRLLSGRNVLVMNAGSQQAVDEARSLFADTMAEVREIELDQHDRLMALVLGLSHAVNIAFFSALERSGTPAEALAGIASTTFKRQLSIARDVAHENPDLYFEIQRLNDHGEHARLALRQAVDALQAAVAEQDASLFRQLMLDGRRYLSALAVVEPVTSQVSGGTSGLAADAED
ncbi:MAG: prephenate dehydrogenase/arogenate dehydrogenase family protein [Wenzhouxiangella sp.]|jgi:chorismate mutase/prephenate dehydrogenase|nr:prephenate dehydrogenase/arogenate dehydrogenase family protein [Wenzhouxiangella sp.]